MALRRSLAALSGALLLLLAGAQAQADGALVRLDSRPGVQMTYWWMPREGASTTVLLLSGGTGGIGLRDGQPESKNFLIRSRDEFARAGFNVALLGNASDMRQLNPELRTTPEHVQDIAAAVRHVQSQSSAPLWLVGTSQGTLSAAAAALAVPQIAGVVLTSTLSAPFRNFRTTVNSLPLERLAVPVLVHQHRDDACPVTPALQASLLPARLKSAPVVRYIEVSGASSPSGNVCEAMHYHGYIGIEAQVVGQIAQWIQNPAP